MKIRLELYVLYLFLMVQVQSISDALVCLSKSGPGKKLVSLDKVKPRVRLPPKPGGKRLFLERLKGPRGQGRERTEWFPPENNGDHKASQEYRQTHGLGKEKQEELRSKVVDLKKTWMEKRGIKYADESILDDKLGDIYLTIEDVERLADLNQGDTRKKRGVEDFQNWPSYRWDKSEPIQYIVQSDFDDNQYEAIQNSILHWEEMTCLKFQEIALDEAPTTQNGNYLNFENGNGCGSYIGKVDVKPQPITLGDSCFGDVVGTVAHEIGHAIGMYHTHSRKDRDQYVKVLIDNVKPGLEGQFDIIDWVVTLDTPYDLSSAMQYGPDYFSADEKKLITLRAKDPLLQKNMGYRGKLSFYDGKLINKAYGCNTDCPSLDCKRGGYIDPHSCGKCVCPDGFGGTLCEEVEDSDSECPQEKTLLATGYEQCIESPGYQKAGSYNSFTGCNYLIKSVEGSQIKAYFKDEFGLYMYDVTGLEEGFTCRHYVEIKYKQGLEEVGPRFCGLETPKEVLTSEGEEMVMIFRSDYPAPKFYRRGFKFCFMLDGDVGRTTPFPEVDACQSEPCLNGGACKKTESGFVCDCSGTGYEDETCSTRSDLDECISNPCKNGGKCNDIKNGFSCDCTGTGYEGDACQIAVPSSLPCDSNPCINGGQCANGMDGSYACDCSATGYEGKHCENYIDPCRSNPCLNGGKCKRNDDGSGYCDCTATSYEGIMCEKYSDPCSSEPCSNGGICTDNGDGTIFCNCENTDYEGIMCETHIHKCGEDKPCRNNGKCEQIEGELWFCDCLPNYDGPFCEIYVSPCESDPCLNSGVCIPNGPTTVVCDCSETGYTGQYCDIYEYEDPCKDFVCLNDGVCYNTGDGDASCNCEGTGYEGKLCEKIQTTVDAVEVTTLSAEEIASTAREEKNVTTAAPGSRETNISTVNPAVVSAPPKSDPCVTNPCENGGECISIRKGTRYQCRCLDGTWGKHCEISCSSICK